MKIRIDIKGTPVTATLDHNHAGTSPRYCQSAARGKLHESLSRWRIGMEAARQAFEEADAWMREENRLLLRGT